MSSVTLKNQELEVRRVASENPRQSNRPLVFLHEGLGSVAMWRGFPQWVANATGCEAIVYSRTGYGNSSPAALPRNVSFMHEEALEVLPALLAALGVERPILVGHSDGGSIALIHAARARLPVSALILMAPHVMVEPLTKASIQKIRSTYSDSNLPQRLARYHRDVDAAFWGWNDIWLHPEFAEWSIVSLLSSIRCPILAIQGEDDEYGTMAQIESISGNVADVLELRLPNCGHSPHLDQPQAVIDAMVGFINELGSRHE